MIPVAALGTIWLTLVALETNDKLVAGIYGIGSIGLYAVSAMAHLRVWEPKRLHLLFQFDHSMIMIFIVTSTVPVAYAMGGRNGWLLLTGMAFGAGAGLIQFGCPSIRLVGS